MTFRTIALAAITALSMASAAYAVPVSGQISMNGFVSASGSTSLAAATGLNFQNSGSSDNGSAAGTITSYGAGSGTFAGLTCNAGSCGTIQDIKDLSSTGPVTSFLTLASNAISFDLDSVTVLGRDMATGSITVSAKGIIHQAGYDATSGTFVLTAKGNSIMSFAAHVESVPEPLTLSLLGGSLAMFGLMRRNKA